MEIFRLVFSPIDVNTYIVASDGECAIIDCGCYDEDEFNELRTFLESRSLKPVLLLNTHCHLDHIFGNRFIESVYGLRTWCSQLEEPNRINAPNHALLFGLGMETPPEPAGFLSHGDYTGFGAVKLKALHVPGHTAGSLAFYSETGDVLFPGDALFAGSIGRTDLPGGNFETLTSAIKNHLLTLPPHTLVYPGHGGETTVEREALTNPYLT
jgi:glyoxylase-like metal-dependent hydrolase (beta-lactamase superfamily II)